MARRDDMPAFSILPQRAARLVVGQLAGVGHRQHRDLERHEGRLSRLPGMIFAIAWPPNVLQALMLPSLNPSKPALCAARPIHG